VTNPQITFKNSYQKNSGRYRFVFFENVKIQTNTYSNDITKIENTIFPILFNDKYFHLIIDRCAVFEYIKSIFPDIDTEFFISSYDFDMDSRSKSIKESDPESFFNFIEGVHFYHGGVVPNDIFKGNQFFREMYNIYRPKSNKIFQIKDINVFISKCVFFIGADQPLIDMYESNPQKFIEYMLLDGAKEWLKSINLEWQWAGLKALKDKMIKKYGNVERNRKIYASRKLTSHFIKLTGGDLEMSTRLQEKEDEVEKYFIDKGFEPVTFEDKSFEEQYKIINSCTDLAGYSGSNLLNLIFSYDPINVHEIVNEKRPYDEYKERTMVFGHNHFKILESRILQKNG